MKSSAAAQQPEICDGHVNEPCNDGPFFEFCCETPFNGKLVCGNVDANGDGVTTFVPCNSGQRCVTTHEVAGANCK